MKSILSIYFLITITVTAIQMAAEYVHARNEIYSRLKSVEKIYYPALATALWQINKEQVTDLQKNILDLPFVSAIRIVDEQKHEVLKSKGEIQTGSSSIEHTFSLNYRVSNADAHLADVTLIASNKVILELLEVSYQMIVINALIKSLALTFLFIWIFRKRLEQPLKNLTTKIATVNLNALEKSRIDLEQSEDNELGTLERAFNSMLNTLDSERNAHAASLEAINKNLESLVASRTEQLEQANQQLEALARTDYLTGVSNRRNFLEQSNAEIQRALRTGALSLLMLDLDKFKQINDKWGHAAGDEVLKNFASVAKSPLRITDLFARIGGEEFAVLLPNTAINGAKAVAERILEEVRKSSVENTVDPIKYTVSIGVSEFNGETDTLAALMQRADAALYRAKESGRNQVQVFEHE